MSYYNSNRYSKRMATEYRCRIYKTDGTRKNKNAMALRWQTPELGKSYTFWRSALVVAHHDRDKSLALDRLRKIIFENMNLRLNKN